MTHDRDPDIRTVTSSVIYEDSWVTLRGDEIERRDGSRGFYAVVDKPHFALIIPADAERFCLVEEYRYPVRRRAWAFPQGGWPGGRTGDPEDLARLELAQETGLRARKLTLLGFLHSSHGTSSQGFHAYLATGLTEGDPDREPEEQDMQQRWVPRGEFKNMIRNGTITDDSTVAAYSLLLLHEESSRNPSRTAP